MKQFTLTVFYLFTLALSAQELVGVDLSSKSLENNQQDKLEFSIFPNPVKNQTLYISSLSRAEKHIEIFNVLGEKKFESFTTNERIFLGELPPGIYIFRLEQEQKFGLKRLVIP